MAARRSTKLSLRDETFGERFHRAYRLGRAQHGFTYQTVAERVSEFQIISDQMLLRIERRMDTVEGASKKYLTIAFLALLAYGFEPTDFGIDDTDTSLNTEVAKVARRVLDPRSRCSSRTPMSYTTSDSHAMAGQRLAAKSGPRGRAA